MRIKSTHQVDKLPMVRFVVRCLFDHKRNHASRALQSFFFSLLQKRDEAHSVISTVRMDGHGRATCPALDTMGTSTQRIVILVLHYIEEIKNY